MYTTNNSQYKTSLAMPASPSLTKYCYSETIPLLLLMLAMSLVLVGKCSDETEVTEAEQESKLV